MLLNKYWVDELYDASSLRPTVALSNWLWRSSTRRDRRAWSTAPAAASLANSRLARALQTGDVQQYALSLLLGALLIMAYYALHDGARREPVKL